MRDQRTAIPAAVNGVAVPAIGSHCDGQAAGGAVVAAVSLRVRLDLDDVAACLWAWLDRGCTVDDLADDAAVRELVVEAVVNRGLSEVTGYRDEVTATPRGTNLVIDACRDAAARLFAPATTVPAPLPALALAGSGR